MKIKQISEHVWSVRMWMIIPIHVWLVVDEVEGVTLIDGGIGPMSKGILTCVRDMGAGPLRRILLTHGHSDHVGAIPNLLKQSKVPVLAHSIEIPYMEGKQAYPGRKKAAASLSAGIAEPLQVGEDGRLVSVGGLIPYHTPGHSPGHVAYYHERDGVLLAGDLFTSKRGELRRPMPMFTADMEQALESGRIVQELRPRRVEVCHGVPVMNPGDQWSAYASRYAVEPQPNV